MKNQYTVKQWVNTQSGLVEKTLGQDNVFYVACNNAMTAESPKALAKKVWAQQALQMELTGAFGPTFCSAYIEGPRGGSYSIIDGRYQR